MEYYQLIFHDVLVTFFIVTICFVGDRLLFVPIIYRSDIIRALVDNATHGAIGLLSWFIVLNYNSNLFKKSDYAQLILCGLLSSLIDLDHFLAARSFKIKDALSLSRRPPFHLTTLIPPMSIFLYTIARLLDFKNCWLLPFLFIVACLSHHVRDGSRRGLWLWPFGSTEPIPYWLYIGITITLPYLTKLFVMWFSSSNSNLENIV